MEKFSTIKRTILAACMFLVLDASIAFSQISISGEKIEMGQVEWYTSGMGSAEITNSSNEVQKIKKIETSSSLLKVDIDKKQLNTGEKAMLTLNFQADLLGWFEKTIYIYLENNNKPVAFNVSGEVVKEKDEDTGKLPYRMGDIEVNTTELEFDDVRIGELQQQEIIVKNVGKAIYPPSLMHLPKYMSQIAEPERLRPGRIGKIIVTIDCEQAGEFGLKQETIYLSRFPGDKVCKDNEMMCSSIILPSIDSTSINKLQKPSLYIDKKELRLPSLEGKKRVSGTVLLKNTGNSKLEIKALQVFNHAINVSLPHLVMIPGSKQKLKVWILGEYLKQMKGRLRILLITNDPDKSKIIIPIHLSKVNQKK